MTIRDLIEMGADLDTPIYICGHIYDYEGTGNLIAKYENANGVDTAQITDDSIVLFGDVESISTSDVQEVKGGLSEELRRTKELLENRGCYIRDLEHELGYDTRIEEVQDDAEIY